MQTKHTKSLFTQIISSTTSSIAINKSSRNIIFDLFTVDLVDISYLYLYVIRNCVVFVMGCDCSKYDDEDNITFVNIAVEEPSPVILEGVKIFQEGDVRIGNYIAEGGNGKVHMGVDKRTKKSYALKFFGYTDIIPSLDAIEREIYLMKQLSGISGVVELVGVMMDSETGLLPKRMSLAPLPVIIMELLQGGELYDHVAKGKVFCEENMAKIITALVGTVLCIHDRNFIHRE